MNINKIRVDEVVRDRDKIIAISRTSPFYPDGKGGQLGDRGKIGPANVLKVKEKMATSSIIWILISNQVSTSTK